MNHVSALPGQCSTCDVAPTVCPTWKRAIARGKGGPGPPERGKDKQSVPNISRDKMGKDEEDRREQSEQPSYQVKFCKHED